MYFLSYIVVEIPLTKMWRERKKDIYKEEQDAVALQRNTKSPTGVHRPFIK